MATEIHPTAVITPGAELGENVSVGPHTVVGANVKLGDGTRVGPQVVIDGVTTIGRDNVIVGQASLGGTPQDLSYRGEATMLEIGDGNIVREFVSSSGIFWKAALREAGFRPLCESCARAGGCGRPTKSYCYY